ncbi:MAG TPA: EAL domain-containing protein [Candidatus Dormibacteraeota bacterium]|nr:EAL domain-containing protein [Candidatus Dormibacteraeota bacterium]
MTKTMLASREGEVGPASHAAATFMLLTLLVCTGASGLAALVDLGGASLPWDHVMRACAAAGAAWLAIRGWTAAGGRERRVRGLISAALVVWLASELLRLANLLAGRPEQSGLELSVVGLALAAGASYIAAAHGRMRASDEAALYLDAATIFAATSAVLLVASGRWASGLSGLTFLTHAAFFLATLNATLILDLATRVPLRLAGAYGVLLGLLLGGIGYLGLLLVPGSGPAITALHATLAGGALLVGYGGGSWSADEDANPRFARAAERLRELMPIAAVALAPLVVIMLVAQPELLSAPLRFGAASAAALAVLFAVVRQTVLLRDREQAVSRERRLRDELAGAEAQYRSVVERVPGAVYVAEVGVHGRWQYVSAKIGDMLGFAPEEWIADPDLWERQIHPADRERMLLAEQASADPLYNGSRWEYRLLARDGREVWVLDDEAVTRRDAHGRPIAVQGILLDISDRKNLEEQLRHQALHDPLTGLPNRVLFGDRVTHALARRRGRLRVAVLFLDIDDFKTINDSLGHAAGDELLMRVAERLTGVLRIEDTACRLGGDEFAILLEEVELADASAAAERVLDALKRPFSLTGRDVTLRASIGVAVRSGNSETAEDLLRDADTAMYAAKSLGKGRIQVFESGMEQPVRRRLEMRSALELALERNELFVEYQPIVDMATHRLTGVEALARWNHPQLGRVMPADFVPLAEEIGLIGRMGEWVLRTVCTDLAREPGATRDGPPITASVNVSAHQLQRGLLAQQVATVLAETGMDPSRLVVELTESTLAGAGEGAEIELEAVHRLGVRVALDDFGSGYSSLEYLGRLPIDLLKIDRSLVESVDTEPQRQEVLRAVGQVSQQLRLGTIVEGVEREAQRRVLLELGFREAQGFLFSRAVPLAEALAYGQANAA